MSELVINDKDKIVMKLLHYFITEQNYTPIVLQGVKDEIWLENMESDYKIVRISSKYIRNSEQLDRDLFITERIIKTIKRKSLSFSMPTLNILLDVEKDIPIPEKKAIESVAIKDEKDIKKSSILKNIFPNIEKKVKPSEVDMALFAKITNEINEKNKEKFSKTNEIFRPKKPIVTIILICINVFIFLLMSILGNGSEDSLTLIVFGANVPELIQAGQYYRLITAGFLHIGLLHLLINCYSLFIIGSQIESFFGRTKYLIIYFFSLICGNLLSMSFTNGLSVGASGAIFGLLGAFLYFGYYYRAYIGGSIIRQVIPVIILNLLLGFMSTDIDNAAHIGGLIGGFLITYALGIKYKHKKSQIINGTIMSVIFAGFLVYFAFFM